MRKKEREITDMAEIESIIRSADVCRIAMADDNVPYIVTMNFGYSGGNEKKIFFHCSHEGRKLEMIRKNNYVCFELDIDHNLIKTGKACDFTMKYKSVVGYGNISIIENVEEKLLGLNCIMTHYSDDTALIYDKVILEKTVVLCLKISQINGKKC